MSNAWIINTARTPRGRGKKGKGALTEIHPQELMAQTLQHVVKDQSIDPAEVSDVVLGCVSQVNDQGACIARNSVLAANWPDSVTGVALNRFCGSGLQAVNFAAMGVMSGQQPLAIGGGVESMSRVALGADGAGMDGNNLHLRKRITQIPQGISADLIATLEGISREEADAFALSSQQKAETAQKEGRFDKSLFPVVDPNTGDVVLEKDEYPRHGATIEALADLSPSFVKFGAMNIGLNGESINEIALSRYPEAGEIKHIHTPGNSSGIVDGAAAVLLASDDFVKAHGVKPRAKIRATATAGDEPIIMLTAPAPASEKALKLAGMNVNDIDLWEINEAFATVPLQTMRKLNITPEKVNVNGGAIALGHPLGATGAMLLGTALDELERQNLSTALITLCIGGGMGIATIIERV